MASALVRHHTALPANLAFTTRAEHSAAARSNEAPPPKRQTARPAHQPASGSGWLAHKVVRRRPNNSRRQRLEPLVVPPLRLGRLARLLYQHGEGRCRGLCPALGTVQVAPLRLEEPLRGLHVAPRAVERCTEVEVRHGLIGPQGDGLAVGPGFSAVVSLRGVTDALSQQLHVLIARLRGVPGCLLRDLAIPLLHHASILIHLPVLLQLLVIHRVALPSARVPWAVDAAPVRRRHLQLYTNRANFVLLTPGAAEASEAQRQRRGQRRAALAHSRRRGGGGRGAAAAGGAAAVASVASLSAFSAVSASRTSLLPAPRSGCCSRSLASNGLGPSSGSAIKEACDSATQSLGRHLADLRWSPTAASQRNEKSHWKLKQRVFPFHPQV
eukprot:scaffold24476_cov62-Phaeocystis_antarctica.AAC.5